MGAGVDTPEWNGAMTAADPLARMKALSFIALFALWATLVAAVALTTRDFDMTMAAALLGAFVAGGLGFGVGVLD